MLQSTIRRGELDRRITFLKPVKAIGSANSDKITSWTEVTTDPTVMARKRDLGGRDVEIAGRLTYAQRTEWVVDYRTDLTSENRLYEVDRSKLYEIIAITDHESSRDRYLIVMANLLDTEEWT